MRSIRIPVLNKSDYGVCDKKKDKKDKENKKYKKDILDDFVL